jgi:hypothetical protein
MGNERGDQMRISLQALIAGSFLVTAAPVQAVPLISATVVDVIPRVQSNETDQNSEPSIAVNPLNAKPGSRKRFL